MPVRILPNGKVFIRNGKVSFAECCCRDGPPTISGCEYEDFNPDIIWDQVFGGGGTFESVNPDAAGDFRGITFTIADNWNGRPFSMSASHVSPRGALNDDGVSTGYASGNGGFIQTLTDTFLYDAVQLSCWEFDPTFTDLEPGLLMGYFWNIVGPGGSGSGYQGVIWLNEVGAKQAHPSPPFWVDIDGKITVLSKNPLHVIAEFTPLSGSYPPDGGFTSSEIMPGVVTIEATE